VVACDKPFCVIRLCVLGSVPGPVRYVFLLPPVARPGRFAVAGHLVHYTQGGTLYRQLFPTGYLLAAGARIGQPIRMTHPPASARSRRRARHSRTRAGPGTTISRARPEYPATNRAVGDSGPPQRSRWPGRATTPIGRIARTAPKPGGRNAKVAGAACRSDRRAMYGCRYHAGSV
jgi:hypothetical protein